MSNWQSLSKHLLNTIGSHLALWGYTSKLVDIVPAKVRDAKPIELATLEGPNINNPVADSRIPNNVEWYRLVGIAVSIKVARILLLFKHAQVQVFRLIHPRAVRLVKLGERPVDKEVMQSILGFFALYMGVFVAASFIMAGLGMDLPSAGASVIATLSNIGPGLGSVGPVDNFAHVPAFGKLVLAFCMLLGRLELFTVLVLVFPSFWRK